MVGTSIVTVSARFPREPALQVRRNNTRSPDTRVRVQKTLGEEGLHWE